MKKTYNPRIIELLVLVNEKDWVSVESVFGTCAPEPPDYKERYRVRAIIKNHWKAMGRTESLSIWYDAETNSPSVQVWRGVLER